MEAKDAVSGFIADSVMGVAGSSPPASAAAVRTTKARAMAIIKVAPMLVTFPIQAAPLVDTQVARANTAIEITVMAVCDRTFSCPQIMYEA